MAECAKKILIIDDEQDVVTYLVTLLQDNGYEVMTAIDGIEALEKLRQERPHLITLDLAMPEKTGVRFYRELRADPDRADIPVLVISALNPEIKNVLQRRLTDSPPAAYLPKPFQAEELLSAVKHILSANGNAPMAEEKIG